MNKFILISISAITLLLIAVSAFGTAHNRSIKWQQMPNDIRYEVIVNDNVWPDRYYASTYEEIDATTIVFSEGYWVFEPSKKPFGGSAWVFHQSHVLSVRGYSVVDITIITSEL